MSEPMLSEIESMARDPKYPTDFEWRAIVVRGNLDAYEATTISNVREILDWQRMRIATLEEALRLVLSRDTGNPDHDWTTCEQPSCVLGRRALG